MWNVAAFKRLFDAYDALNMGLSLLADAAGCNFGFFSSLSCVLFPSTLALCLVRMRQGQSIPPCTAD
jgi:hypothetical protein